jgi:GDPmannose 4,6-dehydratase
MPRALITGITGQDGTYLAEFLFSKGYEVIGTTRNIQNAKELLESNLTHRVELVEWDMLDQRSMTESLVAYRPVEIYNLSALSSGAAMFDNPAYIGEVNGIAVARIQEAIRSVDMNIRFCQASSSELFGDAIESPQSENTTFRPRTPYGAAKLYSHSMIGIYRKRYGLYACSAIFFNHESPRRGLDFVTRKITHEAVRIKLGQTNKLHLGNLDARRDWGFAGDYMRAMWLMLQQPQAGDYVVATGETHSVRELCEIAFGHLNLDYREYVLEDATAYRPKELVQLVGNSSKARKQLGWVPEVGFREMVEMMVEADLKMLSKESV